MSLNTVRQEDVTGFEKCKGKKVTILPNAPAEVFPINFNRVYAILVNNSSSTITLLFTESNNPSSRDGIPLMGRGSSYEITKNNLYVGKILAASLNTAELSVVECER